MPRQSFSGPAENHQPFVSSGQVTAPLAPGILSVFELFYEELGDD